MRAGNNLLAKFIRKSYPANDIVGGAVPSGTVIYENVQGRIQSATPIPAFAIQGVETNKIFIGMFFPGSMDIEEYDECEVTSPPNSPHFGVRYRIDTVQKPNYHPADPRGELILTMVRSVKHGNQYQ